MSSLNVTVLDNIGRPVAGVVITAVPQLNPVISFIARTVTQIQKGLQITIQVP